jgi:hypothetical protein
MNERQIYKSTTNRNFDFAGTVEIAINMASNNA